MDFINRNGQPRANTAPQQPVQSSKPDNINIDKKHRHPSKWLKFGFVTLLYSGTVLAVAMLLFISFSRISHEQRYVDSDLMQAVFVNVNGTNGGQVYFGKITKLTPEYIRLTNVFYIQNQAAQNSKDTGSYNLVKLGCELHGPNDEMIINRDQVFFWENLKKDGQVTQKATEYYKQNPDGQKCTTSSNTQQNSSNTQNGSSTQTPSNTNQSTTTPSSNNKPTDQ